MPFQKGTSGNPLGRSIEKPFRDELRRAIAQDNRNRLRKCVEKLLDLAAEGEPWAIQMLADRLDGRADQAVTVSKRTLQDFTDEELVAIIAEGDSARAAGEESDPQDKLH